MCNILMTLYAYVQRFIMEKVNRLRRAKREIEEREDSGYFDDY